MRLLKSLIVFLLISSTPIFAQDSAPDCYEEYLKQGLIALDTLDFRLAIKSFDGATKCPEISPMQRDSARELESKAYEAYALALQIQRDSARLAAENERIAKEEAKKAELRADTAYKESEATRIALVAQELLEEGDPVNALKLAYFALSSHRKLEIPDSTIVNTFYDAVVQNRLFLKTNQAPIYSIKVGVENTRRPVSVLTKDSLVIYSFEGQRILGVANQFAIKETQFFGNRDFLGISEQTSEVIYFQEQGQQMERLKIDGISNEIKYLEALNNQNQFFIGDNSGKVHHIEKGTDSIISRTILRFDHPLSKLILSHQKEYVLASDLQGQLKLYNTKADKFYQLEAHNGMVQYVEWSLNDDYFLSLGLDSTIQVCNNEGLLLNKLKLDHLIHQAHFQNKKMGVISYLSNGQVTTWNFIEDKKANLSNIDNEVLAFEQTHSGNHLFYWSAEELTIISSNSKAPGTIQMDSPIVSLKVSPNEKYFATGHLDGLVKLWSLEGDLILDFNQFSGPVHHLLFSSDNEYLIAFQRNGTLLICPNPNYVYRNFKKRNFTLPRALKEKYGIDKSNRL